MPIPIYRAQLRPGVEGIDITVKSSTERARAFAPNWPMVMDLKNGKMTQQEYKDAYQWILCDATTEDWAWLYAQAQAKGKLTLLCYCQDGWFCHTYLLARYMAIVYPELYTDETGGFPQGG